MIRKYPRSEKFIENSKLEKIKRALPLAAMLSGIFFSSTSWSVGPWENSRENAAESLLAEESLLGQAEVALLVTYATAVGRTETQEGVQSVAENDEIEVSKNNSGRFPAGGTTLIVSETARKGFKEANSAWQRAIAAEYSGYQLSPQQRVGPTDFRSAAEKITEMSANGWPIGMTNGSTSLTDWMQQRVESRSLAF